MNLLLLHFFMIKLFIFLDINLFQFILLIKFRRYLINFSIMLSIINFILFYYLMIPLILNKAIIFFLFHLRNHHRNLILFIIAVEIKLLRILF